MYDLHRNPVNLGKPRMALNLLQSYADDNNPCSKNRFDATSKEVT